MGGLVGENEAREELLRALPEGCGVSQVISRKGDELRLVFPGGGEFVVRAPRLWLSWEPPDERCRCRSYFERTGEHAEGCPLYGVMSRPADEYLLCEKCGTRLPVVNTPVGPHEGCGGNLVAVVAVERAAARAEEG